jgi:hypothetical protein
MGVMNFVFPITALYFGPLALWFYLRWGRVPRSVTMAHAPAGSAVAAHAGPGATAHAPGGPPNSAAPLAGQPAPDRGRPWRVTMATEVSH